MRCTIQDLDRVNAVMRHPDVHPWMVDDFQPSAEEYSSEKLLLAPSVFVLMPSDGVVFVFHPWNRICFEAHAAAIPEVRGNQTLNSAKDALKFIFSNTPCHKVLSKILTSNIRARSLLKRLRFRPQGTLNESVLKDGKIQDLDLFGITRKEFFRWDS